MFRVCRKCNGTGVINKLFSREKRICPRCNGAKVFVYGEYGQLIYPKESEHRKYKQNPSNLPPPNHIFYPGNRGK